MAGGMREDHSNRQRDAGIFEAERCRGRRIAFVPTMGYFHEGHLNLMRIGRKRGDCLVVSIYVNPTQFAPTEDFEAYPRDFERDRQLAEEVGVDVIFYPDNQEMYPEGYQTYVEVEGVTNNLCGISRPRFFRGVTTVCTKLFHIVKPHVTIFGKKDFQQYVTIKRMVRDLNMDIEVIGMETTREPDGLAMSSRNVYLKPDERESALSLSRSLGLAEELYDEGERDAGVILAEVREVDCRLSRTRKSIMPRSAIRRPWRMSPGSRESAYWLLPSGSGRQD